MSPSCNATPPGSAEGATPLCVAARHGESEIVQMLIDEGRGGCYVSKSLNFKYPP